MSEIEQKEKRSFKNKNMCQVESVEKGNKVCYPYTLQQIKASAGSGKTHTLISKLLEIFCVLPENSQQFQLSENHRKKLSSVLAITFTNAAATDMKTKLISRLKSIALGLEKENYSVEQAKNTIKACIANYSALNIRTIDSFLLMLLKQNIFAYHLPPRFDILFSNEEFFSPLYDDLAFSALYKNKNPQDTVGNELLKHYEEIYSNFLQLTEHKGFLGLKKVRTSVLALCSALTQIPEEKRAKLTSKDEIYAASIVSQEKYERNLLLLDEFINTHKIKIKKDLKDAILDFKEKKKISSLFAEKLEIIKSKAITVKDLKILDEVENAEKSRKLDTLIEDISKAHKKAFLLKSSLKFLPFIILARLTLEIQSYEEQAKEKLLSRRVVELLSEAIEERNLLPAMLERMSYDLNFLFVDEFQDTNKEQWDIISQFVDEIRAHNGAFTYVGDVKQAIYSWRGGDSTLFEDVYAKAHEPKDKEFLDTNWRSSKHIIEFNNKVFEQFENLEFTKALEETIMKADCYNKTSFATDLTKIFSQVAQKVSKKNKDKDEGRVCLYPFESPGNSNEVLHSKLKFHFLNALSDAHLSYDYKDMAVLVRGNTDAALFAQWLTEQNIPVITEGALLLSANHIIKQCISFLEFLKDENNTIALWHLLGFNGLFSFDNTTPLDLNDYFEAKSKKLSLYECLKNKNSYLSTNVVEIIDEMRIKKHEINVYSLICLLFEKTNCYLRFPQETGFYSRFLELVYQADKNKISSIISFLAYWEEEGSEEKIPMPEGINAVRIMTIHKSKGAEFDVVYVWDNLKKSIKSDGLKLYEINDLTFFAPNSSYHQDYENDNKTVALEAMNLLYVALTRAKKELHIFYKESTSSTTYPLPFIFSDIQANCTRNEALSCYEYGVAKEALIREDRFDLSEALRENYANELSSLKYKEPALNYSELSSTEENKEMALQKGLIFHAFLEKYFKYAKYAIDKQELVVENYIYQVLSEYSLDSEQEKIIKESIVDLFNWIKSLEFFDEWKNNSLSEQNMLTDKGELLRADLCVFSDKSISIIDFKTGAEHEKYSEQLRNYMQFMLNLPQAQAKEVKAYIVYLDLRKIKEVKG